MKSVICEWWPVTGTSASKKKGQPSRAVLEMLRNVGLRLLFSGSGLSSGVGVFLGEALDTASGVHELLLASEERVAIGTDFDAQHIALNGRASGESVPTSAVDGDCVIVGMNTRLH